MEAKGLSISQLWPITLIIVTTMLIVIRLLYVLDRTGKPLKPQKLERLSSTTTPEYPHLVLGSGRHSAEMINLLSVLQKDRFSPRFYIAAVTDSLNLQKVTSSSQFMQVYRSREVGQSYITFVWTTSVALAHALWLMLRIRPQVVMRIRWTSVFYVESIASVRRLSLSGLLLYKLRIADQFFVQWPQLQRNYPRAHYVGCLM